MASDNRKQAVSARVERWVRTDVQALKAYHVPAIEEHVIKLDAMENPYHWPSAMQQAWLDALQQIHVNRYPDADCSQLKQAFREAFHVAEDYELLFGNGSDELIQLLAMAVAGPKRTILAPEPSFVMYKMIAQFLQMNYVGIPLGTDFSLDVSAMLKSIETHNPALIFLAQPNNPTGNVFGEEKIRRIIEATSGLVVIDEAYTAFSSSDGYSLLADYSNVVIMRTLSKVGLAGLRLGYLIGHPGWLEEVNKLRLPYNINVLTQASTAFALRLVDELFKQTAQICADRELLKERLSAFDNLHVWPSEANFLLCRTLEHDAAEIQRLLLARGVLIKSLHGSHPLLNNCLRITVGTPNENEVLLRELAALLAS